jgi:lantibiotic modifying enzyme
MSHADAFLDAAITLGSQLCRDAIWSGGRCNWMGDSMEFVDGSWTIAHRALGPCLYDGTSGIALFLSRLYRQTGDPIHRKTATAAARQASSRLDDVPTGSRMSVYSGHVGVAYAFLELGESLDDGDWRERGLGLLESLRGCDLATQGLDVVGGVAGAILALLNVAERYPRVWLFELARSLGKRLIQTAHRGDDGWSWNTLNAPGGRNLTGFSHGAAGIALALLELSQFTDDPASSHAAEMGFAYERRWYSPSERNWPDLRGPADATPTFAVAWCHGAPGIGLSRLRAFALTGDPAYRAEAEAAIVSTSRSLEMTSCPGAGNYSLCHGHCGNAELLLIASRILGEPGYKAVAEAVGRRGIEFHLRTETPWPCGVNGGRETPNLLLGLAGIGDFYLRLALPDVHTPLVLIGPSASRG